MNIGVKVSVWTQVFISLGWCPRVEPLGHTIVDVWFYKKRPNCFLERLCHLHPHQPYMSDPFLCVLTSTWHCHFSPSYSGRYTVMSHGGFSLHSLVANAVWHLFLHLFTSCISSSVKCLLMSFLIIFLPVIWQVLLYSRKLALSSMWFTDIFSKSVSWLYILFTGSFTEWMSSSNLSIFFFYKLCFWC